MAIENLLCKFSGLAEDWVWRAMNDTEGTRIKLLEVKNTLSEMKNAAAKINNNST